LEQRNQENIEDEQELRWKVQGTSGSRDDRETEGAQITQRRILRVSKHKYYMFVLLK